MRRRGAIGVGRSAALLLGVGVLVACVGSQTRQEFEEEMRARGGGLDQRVAADAVDAVEESLDVGEVKLRSLSLTPGQVTLQIQVPDSLEDLDTYGYGTSGMYGGGGLSGPRPVHRDFDEAELESQVFTSEQAGIDHLDETVDAARREADLPGGYATSASVTRHPGGPGPQIAVEVTNDRRTVTVVYAADGSLVEVQR